MKSLLTILLFSGIVHADSLCVIQVCLPHTECVTSTNTFTIEALTVYKMNMKPHKFMSKYIKIHCQEMSPPLKPTNAGETQSDNEKVN